MLPQFLSAPLTKLRSLVSSPAPRAAGALPQAQAAPGPGGSLRRARALSSASSITLGPPLPTPPPAAATQPSELLALGHQADLIANFWGRGQGMPVREPPQKDKRGKGSRETSVDGFELEVAREPRTLARKMFMFGFLLPLLWMLGAALLCRPTKYEPDLERASVASAEDLQRHKGAYRAAEEKWARRCLVACMSFWGVVVVVVTTVVLAEKNM